MRPVAFTFSGSVAVPMDRVFALISDPTRMAEWLPGCRSVTPTPAPQRKGKGDRHRIQYDRDGQRSEAEIEIIDYKPPDTYGWVEISGRAQEKTLFALAFQGGATKVTMRDVWVPANWRAWLLGQLLRRRSAARTFNRLLQNLRKILTR